MTAIANNNPWGATTTPSLEEDDLLYFCKVIEDRAGISLKASKRDLVRTRLRSRVTANGLNSYGDYRKYLTTLANDDPEWEYFTNLLTTNKTDFFREPKHFEYLVQTILPEWLKTREKVFKVWSAASSTGEEPFTLAMVLSRYIPQGRDFKILATDIDTDVLSTAQNSVYPVSKKPEIPVDYLTPCLDIGKGDARGWFRMKPHLRSKIVFKQHNLIERTSPGNGVFDLVVCRNVLIYFSPDTIDFVQKKLHSTLKKDGHLFIGHSESFQGISHSWASVGPSVFKRGS